MTRPTLVQQFDSIEFSDTSVELSNFLGQFAASDEAGAVIIITAAKLMAREHPGATPQSNAALGDLIDEFADLVFEVRRQITASLRPALRVVGGTSVQPPRISKPVTSNPTRGNQPA